jgi:predicted GNAT superfamily acetyltransferase
MAHTELENHNIAYFESVKLGGERLEQLLAQRFADRKRLGANDWFSVTFIRQQCHDVPEFQIWA